MRYAALLTLCLVLLGCAGGARPLPEASSGSSPAAVSAMVIPAVELRRQYGQSALDNPFLSPKAMITRKSVAFFVLRLEVTGPAEVELLEAEAADESGKAMASLYSKREFQDLAKFLSGPAESPDRQNKIQWHYLPSGKVQVRSGTHSYLLVLVGKPPFPDALAIRVRLLVDGEERSLELPVTAADAS